MKELQLYYLLNKLIFVEGSYSISAGFIGSLRLMYEGA
jgi:hypothetical protein